MSLERTFTSGPQFSAWKLTSVSPIEITRWHIQVAPAVSMIYVPPEGSNVHVVFDPHVVAPTDAGVDTDGDGTTTSVASSGSFEVSQSELPKDHVLVGEGTLTVVCGSDPSLCEDVRFEVAVEESDADAFTLEATASRSMCASPGASTDLLLEPVQP